MKKRGQVSLFMIIGIVTLLVFISLFFIISKTQLTDLKTEDKNILKESASITSFVESCLRSTADDGILYTASHGGYYHPGLYFFLDVEGIIPFFYSSVNPLISPPSVEKMEEQLGLYVSYWIDFCISNSSLFPGAQITLQNLTEVSFSDNEAIITLVEPVKISRENIVKEVVIPPVRISYPFQKISSFIGDYDALQRKYPNSIPLTSLLESSIKHKLELNLSFGENTVIYILKEPNFKIRGDLVEFKFASDYNYS